LFVENCFKKLGSLVYNPLVYSEKLNKANMVYTKTIHRKKKKYETTTMQNLNLSLLWNADIQSERLPYSIIFLPISLGLMATKLYIFWSALREVDSTSPTVTPLITPYSVRWMDLMLIIIPQSL
jgi:hypothetical protein